MTMNRAVRRPHGAQLALAGMALAVMSALAPDATAQARGGDFRWSKAVDAGKWVRVYNVSGDVTVRAVDGDRVEVVGRPDDRYGDTDDMRVAVHEGADGVTFCVVYGPDADCDDRGDRGRSHRDRRSRGSIDLDVRLPRRLKLVASSVSGNVEVTGAGDELQATSVSGDVRVQGVRVPKLTASTVSGDVEVDVDALTGSGDLRFNSVSGDVTLRLPRSLDADFRMRTVSGELDSDFQMTIQGSMRRRGVEGRIGRGGRELELSTVSGDVRLRAK